MNTLSTRTNWLFRSGLIFLGILVSGVLGQALGQAKAGRLDQLLYIAVFAGVGLAILQQPFLGVAVIITTLPLIELLPSVPFITSVVPLIGAITVMAYVSRQRWGAYTAFRFSWNRLHLLIFLFVGWLFLTHPIAATLLGDRNWLSTFVQLSMLSWMTGQLLTEQRHFIVLMWIYSSGVVLSGVFSIIQGVNRGELTLLALRAGGLSGGANSAARYSVVAIVFLLYLVIEKRQANRPLRLFAILGIGILIVSVSFSASRSGLVLLLSAIALMLTRFLATKRRWQAVFLGVLLTSTLVLIPNETFTLVNSDVIQAIVEGTDTVGLRYELWKAALRMWQDYPIAGIGIGQYPANLFKYAHNIPFYYLKLGAHNMYLQVLAETGIVGFMFFLAVLGIAVLNMWRASQNADSVSFLAWTWLIAFIALIIGGITKHDHYDKLLWLMIGISSSRYWLHAKPEDIGKEQNAARPS